MTFTHDNSVYALDTVFEEYGDSFMVFSAGGREYEFVVERIANVYRGIVYHNRTKKTVDKALYVGLWRADIDNDIIAKMHDDWEQFTSERGLALDADSPFIAEKVKRAIRDANPRNTQEEPRD